MELKEYIRHIDMVDDRIDDQARGQFARGARAAIKAIVDGLDALDKDEATILDPIYKDLLSACIEEL